ncbi:hypothetical protein ADK86_23575 [Streptomyces sp. NRRL F-5755]|uniref:hypothetical protein n=1 Tax=Streptomyces sp. NRRL F-5755 TaxID=1519475 RepID=UPI0006AE9AD5|nr:hypothetical protein [Streptomyces sp. NRRL F-5755]KOT91364.1 hypothetical protein ADK86_23575 [Streptomyces sp. NRRL F-5755]
MPRSITITGTRTTGHHSDQWYDTTFAAYLAPFATLRTHFFVGGAKGIDSLALLWLAAHTRSAITVVMPATLEDQPEEAQQAVARCRSRITEIVELKAPSLHSAAYHARNRWMVDRSELTIGFPQTIQGESTPSAKTGTWQTLNYTAVLGKPRLIVPI